MKEVKKSILISVLINFICLSINMITYWLFNKMFLCVKLSGGEWVGYDGFGVMLNRTFPISTPGTSLSGECWISFEPISLLVTLANFFIIPFILMKRIIRNKPSGTEC